MALAALVVALLTLAAVAEGRSAATNLSLDVTFSYTGEITVNLPDGTPVGTRSGSPSVIPAGLYTVLLSGPGGCAGSPYFELKGPGVNIVNNLNQGQETSQSIVANLLPNSNYTWMSFGNPTVVYMFATSAQVEGATSAPSTSAQSASQTISGSAPSELPNTDIVGSAITPYRGTLTVAANTSKTLTLTYKGKSVRQLSAGRYIIVIARSGSPNDLVLEKTQQSGEHNTVAVFGDSRSVRVDLTDGKWLLAARSPDRTYPIVVATQGTAP